MKILESYTVGWHGPNLPPHNDALRITITPPSTRRYHVTQMMLYLYRSAEPTVQGATRAYVTIQRGTGETLPIVMTDLAGTEVGASRCVNLMTDITLHPGDTLRAYTIDTSTGGTVSYWITINYDAIP